MIEQTTPRGTRVRVTTDVFDRDSAAVKEPYLAKPSQGATGVIVDEAPRYSEQGYFNVKMDDNSIFIEGAKGVESGTLPLMRRELELVEDVA